MVATKSPFTRGHWFQGMKFDPRVDNVLSLQDEEQHAKLRAQLIPGVHLPASRTFPTHLLLVSC